MIVRSAIHRMRAELRDAKARPPAPDPLTRAGTRLKNCVVALSRLSQKTLDGAQKDGLRSAIEGSVLRLMEITEKLAA